MNTIKLYNNTPLNYKNNYIIDDIDTFLEDYLRETITDFIFIDTSKLETFIILSYNYDEIDYASKAFSSVNYIALEQGGRYYYYFVIKASFAARNSVRLELRMDTLNTFNNYYTLSNRTLILREHKDRFYEFPFQANYINRQVDYYARKIDKVSEGISPALYNTGTNFVVAKNIWYLIYQTLKPPVNEEGNEELINPVECILVPKEPALLNVARSNNLGGSSFDSSKTYYCIMDENGLNSITLAGEEYSLKDKSSGTARDNVTMLTFSVNNGIFTATAYFTDNTATEITSSAIGIMFNGEWDYINYVDNPAYILPNVEEMKKRGETLYPKFYINTHLYNTTKTINDIDRTDSRLIKIIELPYPPLPISYDNLQSQFLTYYNGMFKLKDLNVSFKNTIASTDILYPIAVNVPQDQTTKDAIANFELGITDLFESKLYHSDFYYTKYFYDSFSIALQYELFDAADIEDYSNTEFTIDFIPTTTINSRFLFKFNFEDGFWLYQNQDFNQIINVARSNELTIYNNSYINYLRAGYNYDVKSKQRNITSSWVGVGLSAIGTIASFASSVYTGGIGIAGGIGMATSTAGQIYNAVNNQIQSEQNFSAKMQQLEMQSASVYGADDIDLLNAYGGQELKESTYQVSKPIRDLLLKLFYLTGYTSNRYGVPVMNTRKIFDYCQANIVFEYTTNLTEEMQIDIAQRFADGVYTFHRIRNTGDATSDYDLSFEHENLETWLYDLWR